MYDVIIIGSGPAGITAGIYIKRAEYNVLVFSCDNNKNDYKIENYYGFEKGITRNHLYDSGKKQAENIGAEILNKEVIGLKYCNEGFEVITANQGKDEKYFTKFVVIATGVNRNKPDIKGIDEFEGKGISYCAVCDAPFFKQKTVAVLGSGEYAIGEIEELLPIAKKVIMLTNGEKALETRLEIDIEDKPINQFRGNNKVEEIIFKDGTSQKADGIFIAQGVASSIDFARKIGARIDNNCIVVNNKMETSIQNIYACGDCTGGILQIHKAAYEGMITGLEIIKKLRLMNKKKI